MERGRRLLLFVCAIALGLVVGVPSLELMERILLQEKDGKRAFIADPLTTSLSQPLPRTELAAYLSRYPEVTGVDRAIAGLTDEATTSTAMTISLAPHDPSKDTEHLLNTSNEVFFVTDIRHGKVFQQIDPIQDNATAIVDRWANLLGETDTTRQSAIFDEIKTAAKAIYVLHEDGVLRRISPSSQFSTILSKKAPAVAALPPTTFTSYATPGTVLSLAEMRNDFVRVSLDEKRDLVVTPLRDFVPGFDPEDPYALVTLSDPDTLFIFPLDMQGPPKPALEQCSDKVDNDNDGLIDCRDALCENDPECVPPNGSGTNDTGEPAQAAALMGEEVLNSGGEVAQGSPQSDAAEEIPTTLPSTDTNEVATEPTQDSPTESPLEAATAAPLAEGENDSIEIPTEVPTEPPTEAPTDAPPEMPTDAPTDLPTEVPTEVPTDPPTEAPTEIPTELPTEAPTDLPTEVPTEVPTELPTTVPTDPPTEAPTDAPTEIPTQAPTDLPTNVPTEVPTEIPTQVPTDPPTEAPTDAPTEIPTQAPTDLPTEVPTDVPTEVPTEVPTDTPTEAPTEMPTELPTEVPTDIPTEAPTDVPTEVPTVVPTDPPTEAPTDAPTEIPTQAPTDLPTEVPTEIPTEIPTGVPTDPPTVVPTETPTETPTEIATETPTPVACGNSQLDSKEECDESSSQYGDAYCKQIKESDRFSCNSCECVENPCGNSQLDSGEECDGSSSQYGNDYCKKIKESDRFSCDSCECVEDPSCGNSQLDSGEECDGSSSQYGDSYCKQIKESDRFSCNSCECVEDPCGNKRLDSGEECDGSSSQYGDGYCKKIKESDRFSCNSCECVEDPCGNKRLDSGEECDGSSSQYGDGYCKKIKESDRFSCNSCECVEDPCGNKRLDSGEECDESTSKYGDAYCKKIKENDRVSCDTCECVEEPCGNDKIDQGEECDDGNTEDGDGCTKQCKKECSVGVESVFSDELQMKKGGSEFGITSTDPIDEKASHCDIVAVSSTRPEPTNKPPRNALGGSIGSPKFSYKRVSSKEITGKLSGLLWYGHGDGLLSCIPEAGGLNGEYSFELTVELKNGTKQTIENEAFIGYGSGAGGARAKLSFGREIETKRLPGYPKKKGIGWECCVAVGPDSSDDLVTIQGYIVEKHPQELQYASLANSEEAFHARQGNAEVEYQQGGYKKDGVRLDSDAEVLRRYGLTQVCGRTYLRDKEVACLVARERAYKESSKIASRMLKDWKRWEGEGPSPLRCHVEYTAKKAIGFTRDKVGMDYKCGYELPGCPNPAPVPPYFWEFIGR